MALRLFEPVAQPVERRAQIVGDRIGDFAHALHQPLDAIEHAVEIFAPARRTRRAHRRSARGARNRRPRSRAGAVDGVEPRQHVAADQGAADKAQEQHQADAPGQRGREQALGLVALMHVARDEQTKSARQRRRRGRARDGVSNSVLDAALIIELDEVARQCRVWPATRRDCRRWACSLVGEEIEPGPPCAERPMMTSASPRRPQR